MVCALLYIFSYPDTHKVAHEADRNLFEGWVETWVDTIIIKDSFNVSNIPLDTRYCIYYSGHGTKETIMNPDLSHTSIVHFRNTILSVIPKQAEIFWIMDCCNPNGLHLPYRLTDNSFRLLSSAVFVANPILLFTSAEQTEEAHGTKDGSLFTRLFIDYINKLNQISISKQIPLENNRNICRMMRKINAEMHSRLGPGYKQTAAAYSSYLVDPLVWLWIGNNNSSVSTGSDHNTLVVSRLTSPRKKYHCEHTQ